MLGDFVCLLHLLQLIGSFFCVRELLMTRKGLESLYGRSRGPIEPTPITKLGAGEEKKTLCGVVTECKSRSIFGDRRGCSRWTDLRCPVLAGEMGTRNSCVLDQRTYSMHRNRSF
jgi:hypothetical protein